MERANPDGPRDGTEQSLDTILDNAGWILRRERFYERAIGPMRQPAVYHWEDDNNPHIDVYVLGASPGRPHQTMVTGGMADRPMPGLRAGKRVSRRVELIVDLPRAGDWLAMILRDIAGVPFQYGTFFEEGTLIQGTTSIRPGSALRHAVLANAEHEALQGFVVEGEIVRFLSVVFISDEELHFGRSVGGPALVQLIRNAGMGGVLEEARESVL